MTSSPSVQVLILDAAAGEKCEARCGLDWSSPEVLRWAREQLHQVYGETVQLEYIDLADPEARRLCPEVVERVEAQKLSLPLLVLNGSIRLSGYFDLRMLQDALQAEMEISYG